MDSESADLLFQEFQIFIDDGSKGNNEMTVLCLGNGAITLRVYSFFVERLGVLSGVPVQYSRSLHICRFKVIPEILEKTLTNFEKHLAQNPHLSRDLDAEIYCTV